MTRGVRLYLVGSLVLVSLAGCGRGFFQSAEREPWRAEAEEACLKSGAVKESAELVRIDPISGPGVCGAEFPLKVSALGEPTSTYGFADDDPRPPATIGNQPRWPGSQPSQQPGYPSSQPYPQQTYPQRSTYPETAVGQPGYGAPSNGPLSLQAPGVAPDEGEIDLPPEGCCRVKAGKCPSVKKYMGRGWWFGELLDDVATCKLVWRQVWASRVRHGCANARCTGSNPPNTPTAENNPDVFHGSLTSPPVREVYRHRGRSTRKTSAAERCSTAD